jgi:hypothetical protein
MKNLNEEKIAFIRHIWTLNYCELGFGTPLVNLFGKYPFYFIFGIFGWMLFIPLFLKVSILLCFLPVYILGASFVLMLIDSIYTSKKIYNILELCKTHVDENLTLEELIAICQN